MKLLLVALSLLMLITPARADIYRGMNEEGNVTYSDEETPDSEKIPTPSPNTITMPKLQPKAEAEQSEQEAGYVFFRIASPGNDTTVRSNEGNLSVSFSIEPELDIEQGHTISVLLDGRVLVKGATQTSIKLENIDRGSHALKARVMNQQGRPVISSNSVRIHMKRLSTQHKKPAGTPPGPSAPDGSNFTPGPQGSRFIPGPVTPPPAP